MDLIKSNNKVLIWLWLSIIIWIVMARLSHQSLFGDGLLYASMSRNLAEGVGDHWHLYFAEGYWVPDMPKYYYENPPLMIWVQSVFFRLIGDHWWTEKVFCFVMYLANVFAFRYVWFGLKKHLPTLSDNWLFPVITWTLIPVAVWSNANNMMDNMLLFWCLLSFGALLRACNSENAKYGFLAGIFTYFGIMAKGPVALYPLAFPAVLWFVTKRISFTKSLLITIVAITLAAFFFIILVLLNDNAAEFWSRYWNQRLLAVITGERKDMALAGWSRLYIIKQYILEGGITLVLIVLTVWRRKDISKDYLKWVLIFILMSLAATLPIVASTKQSGIYLVPGLPMLSLALAILWDGSGITWFEKYCNNIVKFLMGFCLAGFLIFFNKLGSEGRDSEMISAVKKLRNSAPEGSVICVDSIINQDFRIHGYMQRIGKYSLKVRGDKACNYQLIKQDKSSASAVFFDNTKWDLIILNK